MKNLQTLADTLKILPKLRLSVQLERGGVKSTGVHRVKFLEEPTTVMGKDDKGVPRKELKFVVEENGIKYRWMVPILNKEGQPNYLVERLLESGVKVGEERELEMLSKRGRNYVDVRMSGEVSEEPDEHEEPVIQMEDEHTTQT